MEDESSDDSFSRAPKVRRLDEAEPESDSSGFLSPSPYESFKEKTDLYLKIVMAQGLSPLSLTDEDYMFEEDTKAGYRMMEVFSVQFLDHGKVNLEEMYGLLLLDRGFFRYVLFERFPGDPLPIDSNGFVKLTGPAHIIDGDDRIEFDAYLIELNGHVCHSYKNLWNGVPCSCSVMFNKLLSKTFNTMFGPVQVNFAILTPSNQANVEVKLLDWKGKARHNGKNPEPTPVIEVFGEVTVRSKLITDERAKSYMFKREKDMCALVRPGGAIPLSRSCAALPVRSSAVLDVNLLFHPFDSGSASGADDLIVNDLEVAVAGKDEEFVLNGNSARIQLKITWQWGLAPSMSHEGVSFGRSSSTSKQGCKPLERMKQRLPEVFDVRLYDESWIQFVDDIYGFALLESSGDSGVLFRRTSHDPPFLKKTGVVKLNGPMHGTEVKDELAINTYLWTLHTPTFNELCAHTLWRAGFDQTDEFICKRVETDFGPLEVTFAVYSDSFEAYMQVSLVDWNAADGVEAFGTVDAGNSRIRIPGNWGISRLFDRPIDEAVSVKPGKDVTNLPLSRSVTVVPRESIFYVRVAISRLEKSRMYQQKIFQELRFDTNLTGTQMKVAYGDCGNVEVTVTIGR